MLVNLKVRTCIVLVLVLFTGAMFISNGVAWMGLNSSNESWSRSTRPMAIRPRS